MSAVAPKGGATDKGGQESDTLDLMRPGKLWCQAQFERDTTFHLVLPQKRYQKGQLTLNPQISPNDQIMRPWVVPTKDQDKEKKTYCDLDTSGRAIEIMQRLTERYDRGEPRIETIRAVYIATARNAGERDPQVAEVKDLKLVPIPRITLRETGPAEPLPAFLTALNFKGGRKDFKIELTVSGNMREVDITVSNPELEVRFSEGNQKGKGKLTARIEEGKKYQILLTAPFKSRTEKRRTQVPIWGRFGYRGHYYQVIGSTFTEEVQELWEGAITTLRVQGTGAFKGISRSLALKAESWAPGWLYTVPPPAIRHCCC